VEPLLRRWALVRTGDPSRAAELVQNVLLRVHEHLSGFRGEAPLESWLYRITMNEAATLERRRSRPTVSLDRIGEGAVAAGDAAGAGSADEGADGIDVLYARDVAGLVGSFFRELPDRQRQVFDLVDLQGHAPAEVAGMLELSPSTVRVTLLRARRVLRARILELHPELEEGYGRGV
jgi:RNA polymerase sigma-70 factor, ECF subfamily